MMGYGGDMTRQRAPRAGTLEAERAERTNLALAALADPEQPPCWRNPRTGTFGGLPLSAERLGPAWRAMWRVLCQPGWHPQWELIAAVPVDLALAEVTMTNMLAEARRSGLIVPDVRRGAGPRVSRQLAAAYRALGTGAEL